MLCHSVADAAAALYHTSLPYDGNVSNNRHNTGIPTSRSTEC